MLSRTDNQDLIERVFEQLRRGGLHDPRPLLPAKVIDSEPPADLSKLTERQLDVLERLMAIARGLRPPTRQRKKPVPEQTPRQLRALELADLLDRAEAEGALTEADLLQVRNHLTGLMGLLGTLETLVPPEIYAVQSRPASEPIPEPPAAPEVKQTPMILMMQDAH